MELKKNKSFPAIIYEDSSVVILGSLPGEKSLQNGFYYADSRNYFWKFLSFYAKVEKPFTIEDRKKLLKETHVALWDIYQFGYRCDKKTKKKSSKDTDIQEGILNDIPGFLKKYPNIKAIGIAGKPAFNIFKKEFPQVAAILLPSTSGGNCRNWGNACIPEPIDINKKGWQEWSSFLNKYCK